MKHASPSTPPKFPARLLSALLAFAMCLPALPERAQAAEGDIATNALTGLNTALGGLNSFQTAFGASQGQLQAMIAQLTGAQNATQGAQQSQGQLNQIAVQLQMAIFDPQNGVQACLQKATRTYEKFHKNHKKAGDIAADKIPSIEPTCSNYGLILDAAAVNDEKVSDANKKMACIVKLQNTVSELANKAKQPIQQLMTSAAEVYKTHSSIIDSHKQIATKLANDLDGPDGKGGYRAQVQRLRSLSLELNNVLNAKKSEKEGLKHGLVKQVDELQTMRAAMGNDWYYTLMGDVSYCFGHTPQACFDNNETMPPAQCVSALVGNTGGRTAGERARTRTDMSGLFNVAKINTKNAQEKNLPANIDIAKPGEFLGFARKRFDDTVAAEISTLNRHQFAGKVDKAKLKQAVQQGYDACWQQATARFQADLKSKGSQYYSKITAMKDAERETANDLKNWIDRVEGDMTQFRTSFHKVYNSELAQFKTDCTADEDPYKSLDCLRVLSATLDSGLKGTRRAIRLGNGEQFTSFAGETVIPMQTLTLGADGKPTIGNTNASCSGFDDCLNYLDRSKSEHESAAQKGETDRKNFVDQHNSAVRSAFSILSNQFGQMSQLITQGINGINSDLANIGVKGTLKTKEIKAEPLVENEKTGMIDMPKDMKAAMAAESNYSEIEDTKEVSEGIRDLAREVAKKRSEASKMKSKCKLTAEDYAKLEGLMPKDCADTAAMCGGNRVPQAAVGLEDLFKRGLVNPDDADKSSNTSREYNQCRNQVMNSARNVTTAEITRAAGGSKNIYSYSTSTNTATGTTSVKRERNDDEYDRAREDAIALKQAEAEERARNECSVALLTTVEGLAKKARGSKGDVIKNQNEKLATALRDINEACAQAAKEYKASNRRAPSSTDTTTDGDKPELFQNTDDRVTNACEAFKAAAKAGKKPEGEEETGAPTDKSEPTRNVIEFPTFTAPAK